MAEFSGRSRAQKVAESLGLLFVQSRVPIIASTPDGGIVTANHAAIAQYRYSVDELASMHLRDLVTGDFRVDEPVDAHALARPSTLAREHHRRKDGTMLWVVPTMSPIAVDGEMLIVSTLSEASDPRDAEIRLREAVEANLIERQLLLNAVVAMLGEPEFEPALHVLARVFATAIGDPTTIWLPEGDGSRQLRLAASHGVSRSLEAELAIAPIHLDKDSFARRAWDTGVAQLMTRDEAASEEASHRGFRLEGREAVVTPLMGRRGPYGLLYCVDRSSADPQRALTLATTLGSFGGLTLEAVRLEALAKSDRERSELLWQAASGRLVDGVALLDKDLRVVVSNDALRALLRLKESEIVGRRCRDIFEVCAPAGPCPHEVALSDQTLMVREIQSRVTERPLRIEVIPALERNPYFSVIHIAHDLSEERAIRSQLVTADRLATIGRLAAGVAHEVNNPAAFVTVNLGVLRDRFVSGTARTVDVLAMLDESLNGMERIREIVRDLKGFARERTGDKVDLSVLVASAVRMATHETRGRARVEKHLEPGVCAHVRGARIAQVVLNLLVNAAQAIPPGNPAENRIVVRTWRDGDHAKIEVSDTGPGIPPDAGMRIFEPFFTTRESSGGTGLGLWLAREIVEEEGGTIEFSNVAGAGARFLVVLAALRNDASPGNETAPPRFGS